MAALLALATGALPANADVAAWIVVDAKDGTVLEQHEAFQKWYPASLTKMMTAYVVFSQIGQSQLTLQSPVRISQRALNQPPSKMGFKVGTLMTLDSALNMLLVKSANDIAVAISEAAGGSEQEFVRMMNKTARKMGLTHTQFVNPHGLPDNRQVSSARDLAILARALWTEFPQHRNYMKQAGIRFGKRTMRSGNKDYLLRVEGANGLKTGYICNSGYNVATSATRRGRTLIAVVLGAASGLERAAFAKKLIDNGFKNSTGPSLYHLAPQKVKSPPADQYCKRNEKPTAQELVDRFGTKRAELPTLSYANSELPRSEGIKVVSANNKVNWSRVYEEILGPQIKSYAPIKVSVGVAGIKEHKGVPLAENIPLPTAKPVARKSLHNAVIPKNAPGNG